MKIEAIHPITIGATKVIKPRPVTDREDKWYGNMRYSIEKSPVEHWYTQKIFTEVFRNLGGKMCGVEVESRFAMLISDDKLIPSSDEDFEQYADMTSAALAHGRATFAFSFVNTEFVKILLPLKSRSEVLAEVRNAVFSVLN